MVTSSNRQVCNFFPGPSALPPDVVFKVQAFVAEFQESGMSLLEISHRDPLVMDMIDETRESLREVLKIPEDYEVLFMHGGASTQFPLVPWNFPRLSVADYILTGVWSQKAYEAASNIRSVRISADGGQDNFLRIPSHYEFSETADYIHLTSNNTIYGTQFHNFPSVPKGSRIVCDASSDLMGRKIEVKDFSLVYACAQKNLGMAGVTLVIIKRDILEHDTEGVPEVFRYRAHANAKSLYNTPPVLAIAVVNEMTKWIKAKGGIDEVVKINLRKAERIYDFLDNDPNFEPLVQHDESRSWMNVCFKLSTVEMEETFLRSANKFGFRGLRGHRKIGHFRASLYNSISEEQCRKLEEFLKNYSRTL